MLETINDNFVTPKEYKLDPIVANAIDAISRIESGLTPEQERRERNMIVYGTPEAPTELYKESKC